MKGYIDGIDWLNIAPMKYWSCPASYSNEQKKQLVTSAIMSLDYSGALKVDGYYQRLLKDEDGNCFMIARSRNVNGEIVNKIDWVPQLKDWMQTLPNGTCFLSEIYIPDNETSKSVTSILGCLKDKAIERQKKTPLYIYIFDCMAFNGKNFNKMQYVKRQGEIKKIQEDYDTSSYISFAKFYKGQELWDKLQEFLSSGREGMVIMRNDAIVYDKRTPARVSIKVKKELEESIDAVILDANAPTRDYTGKEIETWQYWEDIKTGEKLNGEFYREYDLNGSPEPVTKNYFYGWAGSLVIGLYNTETGKYNPIGSLSGLTEEVLSNWKDYRGKVVEVTGMQIFRDENGKFSGIRHPKLKAFRDDKAAKECTFEQVK